ncbi:MAG: MMPL family transporter [Hydrotalea flava]|nr:MMPL family transporter [Hydrotalea flava]NIM38528.1 MMPL family transporter [Hydrotalea flava]NIN03701.1 MMPL family transporter [Hydrotalea flava]NIN15406.1 MMPL family transporter [Hydrotalea flava]NIO94454.1 MMPL family transporter [Hydrotalea flava]
MWYSLGKFIIKYRIVLLFVLLLVIGFMGWQASKVQLSYDFTKAIPTNNQKYKEYEAFLKTFGSDGGIMVIGIQDSAFYTPKLFNATTHLGKALKTIPAVQNVLSIPDAFNLVKDSVTEALVPKKIFHYPYTTQDALTKDENQFNNLPFYRNLLYNPETHAYLMAVTLNNDSVNSKARTFLIQRIQNKVDAFQQQTGIATYLSGLPYIRTIISNRIKQEMNWFIYGSFLLSAITLFLFFRSLSTTIMSLLVVGFGVITTLGTMVLIGYKITLLTALIPSLIVVIGIPNCIYFLNKYHLAYRDTGDKEKALIQMVGRMGIVTLFCNLAAAIGFAVFALTKSQLLKEFGVVSGINIMALFFISLVFIPIILSFLPAPQAKHVRYLDNKILEKILVGIERWALYHSRWVYAVTIAVTLFAIAGIFRLKSESYIVDDLPKKDKIYTDLKWFENNFKGIMPLEIIVDTKKKMGLVRSTRPLQKIDVFSQYIAQNPATAKPLSIAQGLKFAKQAYFDGDSASYTVPYESDMIFLAPYLRTKTDTHNKTGFSKLMNSFMDSEKEKARISVNMKDIGSIALQQLIHQFQQKADQIFDTANYTITFTGSSVTFLEGSSFIINGLKDSIFWAFLLIALAMFILFKSLRILICSLIPNLIPLVITAGLMGWLNITIKPSTVLVFSVALGIVIDVTIRFLVNFKQELPHYNFQVKQTIVQTIRYTGVSIIYTSLVLIAGFVIFCFSNFGGTQVLGWLTSFTLVMGTLTNLILLPVLLISVAKKDQKKQEVNPY